MSAVGTNRTNRAGQGMSAVQGNPEVAAQGCQGPFWSQWKCGLF
jgi:hypothetical protein